jgi:hypothetical protein
VDDLAFSADPLQEEWLMNQLSKVFITEPAADCTKFCGTRVQFKFTTIDDTPVALVRIEQTAYIKEIGKVFEDLYKKPIKRRFFPGTIDVRLAELQNMNDMKSHEPDNLTKQERNTVQKLLGMLLWASRSTRPDCLGYTVFLAGRAHRWSAQCQQAMEDLISFMVSTCSKALMWAIPLDNSMGPPVVSFDSDLRAPKSHGSFTAQLIGGPADQFRALIHWGSKRSSIACLASATSELAGATFAVQETCNLAEFLMNEIVRLDDADNDSAEDQVLFTLAGDNLSALRIIRRGYSTVMRTYVDDTPLVSSSLRRAVSLRVSLLSSFLQHKVYNITHVGTVANPADMGTKCHDRRTFLRLSLLLGVSYSVEDAIAAWRLAPWSSDIEI